MRMPCSAEKLSAPTFECEHPQPQHFQASNEVLSATPQPSLKPQQSLGRAWDGSRYQRRTGTSREFVVSPLLLTPDMLETSFPGLRTEIPQGIATHQCKCLLKYYVEIACQFASSCKLAHAFSRPKWRIGGCQSAPASLRGDRLRNPDLHVNLSTEASVTLPCKPNFRSSDHILLHPQSTGTTCPTPGPNTQTLNLAQHRSFAKQLHNVDLTPTF